MPRWRTVSIRSELVEEIRKILKTGRYGSVSEFVSEAIRLRLEDSKDLLARSFVVDEQEQTSMPLSRLEQLWWVLAKLSKSLTRKGVDVKFAFELRNCRTLLNFVHEHTCPTCDKEIVDDKLWDLQDSLDKIKRDLTSAARNVGKDYAENWTNEIDRAERGELEYRMSYGASRFVPGLPKDSTRGWARLTLPKPINEDRIRTISEQFGVVTEFEDNSHVIIRGEKASVKKAVQGFAGMFKEE